MFKGDVAYIPYKELHKSTWSCSCILASSLATSEVLTSLLGHLRHSYIIAVPPQTLLHHRFDTSDTWCHLMTSDEILLCVISYNYDDVASFSCPWRLVLIQCSDSVFWLRVLVQGSGWVDYFDSTVLSHDSVVILTVLVTDSPGTQMFS